MSAGMERRPRPLADFLTLAVLVLLTIPVVTTLVCVHQQHWYPTGDMAQAELHMRGFFGHPPLVGAAGRIGSILEPYGQGSHPGPAMWFAMLPVYLLFGRTAYGLMVAVAVVQLAFLVGAVWLVRRLAGPFAALTTATAAALLVHSFGPAVFIEPWNPWLALFPFFACLAASWGVLCGRYRWAWFSVFSGVFAAQCHAGYVPLVAVLFIGLCVVSAVRWRRHHPPHHGRWMGVALATFVLMWIPPLVDQWRRRPGNLRILVRHFASSTEPDGTPRAYVGLGAASKALAAHLSLFGPLVRGSMREQITAPNWWGFAAAVALAAVAVLVLVRRPPSLAGELQRLLVMLAGLGLVGLVATARIFGEFYSYVIRWWLVLVAWTAIAVVLVLVRSSTRAAAVLVGVAMLASVAATLDSAATDVPSPRNSAIVGGLTRLVEPGLARDERYLVRWFDPASLSGVPFGLILELERDGYHVGVDPLSSAAALPHRVLSPNAADSTIWVVTGDRSIADMRAIDDATELGIFDARSPAEVTRSSELRAQLETRLTELGLACVIPTIDNQYGLAPLVIGGTDVPPDVRKIASDYNLLGMPVAAFLVPADAPWYDFSRPGCPD